MIKLAIVDDHALVRKMLIKTLSSFGDIKIVKEGKDGEEALEIVKDEVNVLVLDVSLPGVSGPALIRQLKRLNPDARILMLSMDADVHSVESMIDAGATGYATKGSNIEELVSAIRATARGEKFLPANFCGII